jgi:hypothetical protein
LSSVRKEAKSEKKIAKGIGLSQVAEKKINKCSPSEQTQKSGLRRILINFVFFLYFFINIVLGVWYMYPQGDSNDTIFQKEIRTQYSVGL